MRLLAILLAVGMIGAGPAPDTQPVDKVYEAQKELNDAKHLILEGLHQNPEWIAAAWKVENAITELHKDRKKTWPATMPSAAELAGVRKAGSELVKIEESAYDADPDVMIAKTKLIEAKQHEHDSDRDKRFVFKLSRD